MLIYMAKKGRSDIVDTKENNITVEVDISKILYLAFKRVFDIVISLLGIIVFLPVFIIVACAIRLESSGKAVFTQNRIGLNGKLFRLYKFRSMVANADEVLVKLLAENKAMNREYSLNKKLKNDPRITKIGAFIRKLSIDELPQLFNILKGDMSFIGNRPYLPREKKDMYPYYDDIVLTKPGLTGLWQVSGRSDTSFKFRCRMEAKYSKTYNLKDDVKIFFKTFGIIFKGL